ncbi:MAG TPA: adenylyl-sulfate kinase [Chitinophagaceae bacterium]|nr:adenylyl-sulfate kinase [Chitinophagaceae bacterium]
MIFQFTGLSGAGKSSIAQGVQQLLQQHGFPAEVVDGDQYRQTICKGLGFSKEDRCENIRRLGAVAQTLRNAGFIAIIAAINPYESARRELTERYNAKNIWIHCPINLLIRRDTKGLYKKALLPDDHPEKIKNLTGINDTYEAPADADLVIDTGSEGLQESVQKVFEFILAQLPAQHTTAYNVKDKQA